MNFLKNLFPIVIVVLFLGAAITSFIEKSIVKSLFYLFSAAINICTIFMN